MGTLAKVTSAGQITLPKEIREKTNIEPGDFVQVEIDDEGHIVLAPKPEKQFKQVYGCLRKEVHKAEAHFQLWKSLLDSLSVSNRELNQAGFFFGFTIDAHLYMTILYISKVLDKRGDVVSVWKFLNLIENNLQLFSTQVFSHRMDNSPLHDELVANHCPVTLNTVQIDRNKLDNLRNKIDNIVKWRNKKLAHIDKTFALKADIAKQHPITVNEIEETLTEFSGILNRYSYAFDASTDATNWRGNTPERDVRFIVDAIRVKIDKKLTRIPNH